MTADSKKWVAQSLHCRGVKQATRLPVAGRNPWQGSVSRPSCKLSSWLAGERWGCQNPSQFQQTTSDIPPERRHNEDSRGTRGTGLYSQCTAVLVSAYQQQALLVPKKLSLYISSLKTPLLGFPSQWNNILESQICQFIAFPP